MAEREQQIDLRRPAADALHRREMRDSGFGFHLREAIQRYLSRQDRRRDSA
jgi:hypothetical protein